MSNQDEATLSYEDYYGYEHEEDCSIVLIVLMVVVVVVMIPLYWIGGKIIKLLEYALKKILQPFDGPWFMD